MKKVVLIAIIITAVIAGSVLIGGYLAGRDEATTQTTNSPVSTEQTTQQTESNQSQTYSLDEIKRHDNDEDCWIIIENKVYNVTNFLSEHPGGADRISPYCGEDATQAFNTKDGEGSHSSTARNLREQYLIGSLSN